MGGPLVWELIEVLTTPHLKNVVMLRNAYKTQGIRADPWVRPEQWLKMDLREVGWGRGLDRCGSG